MKSKKRIMVVVTSLCFCLTFMLNSFEVGATSSYIMSVPYTKPSTSDTQGYINVLYRRSNGDIALETWFWSINPYQGNIDGSGSTGHSNSRMGLEISVSNGTIKFIPSVDYGQHGVCSLFCISNSGAIQCMYSDSFESNDSYFYNGLSGLTILNVVPYGNFGSFTGNVNSPQKFSVLYAEESVQYSQMYDTIALIGQLQSTLGNIQSNTNKANLHLSKGVTSLENLEAHAISLIEEAERTNDNLLEIDARLTQIYNQLLVKSDADSDKLQDFESDSDNQSNQLNDMNNQLAVNKPSSDSVAGDVDSNIDYDAIGVFGAVLSPFMGNQMIVKMMLFALSICLVSYIFFGKRG